MGPFVFLTTTSCWKGFKTEMAPRIFFPVIFSVLAADNDKGNQVKSLFVLNRVL